MRPALFAAALFGCLLTTARAAGPAPAVTDLVIDGSIQRVLFERPAGAVHATFVMLPGGAGRIGLDPSGGIAHADNFVVRTAALWLARGFALVIPDAIGGRSLRGRRHEAAYAAVVARLVAFARAQGGAPVVLLGTSQGAIAAMNGAAHLPAGALAGVVLSESVSRQGGSHETVYDADPGGVRAPALVVANRDDACPVAPPGDAPAIAAAMTGTKTQVMVISGGDPGPKPCGSLSPHGYRGIEARVVGLIADWIDQIL